MCSVLTLHARPACLCVARGAAPQEWRVVDPDDGERVFRAPVRITHGREGMLVGHCGFKVLFPGDGIGDRTKLGPIRMDPKTGDVAVICSLQEILDVNPHRDKIEHCHFFTKMHNLHRRHNLLTFSINNPQWGTWAGERPSVRSLYIYDFDRGRLIYCNESGHHTFWHSREPWVISFGRDEENMERLCFDKLREDDTVEREYIRQYPYWAGHPTVDPTGRYVGVHDVMWRRRVLNDMEIRYHAVQLVDLVEPKTRQLVEFAATAPLRSHRQDRPGGAVRKLEREPGEPMLAFLRRIRYGSAKGYMTHPHPAWDRTGQYIAFNSDATGAAQLYVIDLSELGYFSEAEEGE